MEKNEIHYSERVLNLLVKDHGWNNKNVTYGSFCQVSKTVNGVSLTASFDVPRCRYLELKINKACKDGREVFSGLGADVFAEDFDDTVNELLKVKQYIVLNDRPICEAFEEITHIKPSSNKNYIEITSDGSEAPLMHFEDGAENKVMEAEGFFPNELNYLYVLESGVFYQSTYDEGDLTDDCLIFKIDGHIELVKRFVYGSLQHTKDDLYDLTEKMNSLVNTRLSLDGDTCDESQRICFLNAIGIVQMLVNGIEEKDLSAND